MRQYEITFIVDPVLSGDEIKKAADAYSTLLKDEGCEMVHIENVGLKQLAYTINKRNSGIYYTMEFKTESGAVIPKLELALRRDERIMRFLSLFLDKYAVKYNEDKRNGLIGKKESVIKNGANAKPEADKKSDKDAKQSSRSNSKPKSQPAPAKAEPAKAEPAKAEPTVAAATTAAATTAAASTTATSTEGEPKVTETRTVTERRTVKEPVVVSSTETATTEKVDLGKIEGIGPKTMELLNEAGINSYQDLASSSESRLKDILSTAGGAFATMNPSTWGQQAQLAAEGQWDELKTLQDKLDGGIDRSEEE